MTKYSMRILNKDTSELKIDEFNNPLNVIDKRAKLNTS